MKSTASWVNPISVVNRYLPQKTLLRGIAATNNRCNVPCSRSSSSMLLQAIIPNISIITITPLTVWESQCVSSSGRAAGATSSLAIGTMLRTK